MECGYEYYKFAFVIAGLVFVAVVLAGVLAAVVVKKYVFIKDANGVVDRDPATGRFKKVKYKFKKM